MHPENSFLEGLDLVKLRGCTLVLFTWLLKQETGNELRAVLGGLEDGPLFPLRSSPLGRPLAFLSRLPPSHTETRASERLDSKGLLFYYHLPGAEPIC